MAERIKRNDIVRLVKAWKDGQFDPNAPARPARTTGVYVHNTGGSEINIGDLVKITGITSDSELDPDKFTEYYFNNGFLLSGTKYTSVTASLNDVIAVAEEPIGNEKVGSVTLNGLCFCKYKHEGNETLTRVSRSENGICKYDPLGDYIVIAKSSKHVAEEGEEETDIEHNKGYAVLLYDPLSGPFVGAYWAGTHSECSESSNHVHVSNPPVVIKGVTVPLGELETGTKVLIMKDKTSGDWMVTEAECPSE